MNKTFELSHHPVDNATWAKYNSTIFYEANSGIYAYNIASDTVEPMLIEARDNSVVYKYPTVLANGTIFVKGLESSSGATGADGPTYTFVP